MYRYMYLGMCASCLLLQVCSYFKNTLGTSLEVQWLDSMVAVQGEWV